MEPKHITYNGILNERLSKLGFKRKDKHCFSRNKNEFIQTISFGNFCRHEKFVRYYDVMVVISYLRAEELGRELDAYNVGNFGTNIGYLTPENNYKVWRIEDSASDNDILEVVNNMIELIELFAISFFKRFSNIKELIQIMEEGNHMFSLSSDYNLPILYYLNGEKDIATFRLKRELDRKERRSKKSLEDYPFIVPNPQQEFETPEARSYKAYKEFAEKFMQYMNKHQRDT